MRLTQLRDFVDIVEAGSIRAAARRRGISQPVLTKALRSLESDIGARLLHRTSQGIVLTPSGRALLARARAAQMQLAKAREEIAEIAGNRASTVSFGASASGLELVPEALATFHAEYARSHVRIVEGAPRALLPLLRDESLDFFLGPKPTGALDPQIKTRPLFRLPLAVAGGRGHPLRDARSLAELSGARWLLLSAGGWSDSMLGASFKAAGLPQPASITQCESYSTALSLLSRNETLGLIPRQHLLEWSRCGLVQEIAVADRLPELAFAVYLRSADVLTPAAGALLRVLTATARQMLVRARSPGS